MPEASRSGKQRARAAVMLWLCAAGIFRKAEWSANGTGICYNVVMARQSKPDAKARKVGGLVIGRARFAKIGAVEGIQLTQAMEEQAAEAGRKGLTADEDRRTIEQRYRKS